MNIKKVSSEIEQLKFPIIFLFRLITYKNDITDKDMSIILRLFLKHHHIIAMEINLKIILCDELSFMSCCIIDDFYKTLKKKISLLFIIKQFRDIYDDKQFWKLSYMEQPDYLVHIKNLFMANFDCAKGGIPLHQKINGLLNLVDIREMILMRLVAIFKLLGPNIFNALDIPLITYEDFDSLDNQGIIKYLLCIYERVNNLLDKTIKVFTTYNIIANTINSIFNPIMVNICTKNLDSETEIDDIRMLSDTK